MLPQLLSEGKTVNAQRDIKIPMPKINNDIFSGIFPFWPQQIIVTEFDLENDICFAETDRVRKLVSFAANVL